MKSHEIPFIASMLYDQKNSIPMKSYESSHVCEIPRISHLASHRKAIELEHPGKHEAAPKEKNNHQSSF
jgi:hypothetical protein